MNKYKKEIFGGIIILFLMVAGFTSISTGAFRWIGNVKLLDTLTGNLKLNHGLWLSNDSLNGVSKVNTADLQSGSGIKFASTDTYVDDDGTDLHYNVQTGGYHLIDINGATKLQVGSTGTTLFLNDSVRFNEASKTGTVTNAVGYIKVYVGGEVFYIQLYDTP